VQGQTVSVEKGSFTAEKMTRRNMQVIALPATLLSPPSTGSLTCIDEPWQNWDRCYGFFNIFAEKFGEKIAFLTQNKANV
jgi:hypothetical protein